MRRATLLPLLVLALACNPERRARHERLAATLKAPAATLCLLDPKEGGGCNGDCPTWAAATTGHDLFAVAQQIAAIPTFEDPETERGLEDLRERARALAASLDRCAAPIDRSRGLDDAVMACVDASKRETSRMFALKTAFGAFARETKKRAGVRIPDGVDSCMEE